MVHKFLLLSFFLSPMTLFAQLPNKKSRIAVIGSGIAGLSAAHTLRQQGYQNVTIFEKEHHPGGKIKTIYQNQQPYEVGADWISREYHTILKYIAEYDIPIANYNASKVVFADGKEIKLGSYIVKKYGIIPTITSFIKFKSLYQSHRELLNQPGLHQVTDPQLFMPMNEFVAHHGIEPIAKAVELFMVACGYGYYTTTPAIYVLEMMDLVVNTGVRDILSDTINIDVWGWQYFINGYAELSQKMAADLNTKYLKELVAIRRFAIESTPKVELTFADGSIDVFDRVIIAFSPKYLQGIMDTDAEEARIFSRIKSLKYYSTLFKAEGLSKDLWIGLFDDHMTQHTKGHLLALGSYPYQDNHYQATQFGSHNKDQTLEKVKKDVRSLGGEVTEVVSQNEWDYFFHVGEADLRNGFFTKFFQLQGRGGVYYVGGPASMESVEESAKFSVYLVEKFFPK